MRLEGGGFKWFFISALETSAYFTKGRGSSHQLLWWIVEVSERVWITRLFHHSIAPIFEVLDKNPVTLTFLYIGKGWSKWMMNIGVGMTKNLAEKWAAFCVGLLVIVCLYRSWTSTQSSKHPIKPFEFLRMLFVCHSNEIRIISKDRPKNSAALPFVPWICTNVILCQRLRSGKNPGSYFLYIGRVYCPFI